MSDPASPLLEHAGQWFIGLALAAVAWVLKVFMHRHLESMDRLAQRMDAIGADVAKMQGDIRVLVARQDRAEDRIERLEDKQQ